MGALTTANLAGVPAAERTGNILVLCDRAITELGEVRTVEEVLDIRNVAEAFGIYVRKMKAAVEAQSAVQTVVLLAEARIGAELQAAQSRGEVAQHGTNQHVRASDIQPATLPEIGIPRQRAAEYRKLAEAGEDRIRAEASAATAEGRVVTRKAILDTMRPIAAAAAEKVVAFQHRQAAVPSRPATPPLAEPVEGPGAAWNDWTGAVQVVASMRADLPTLALAMPDLNAGLLDEARTALPRLQAWIVALEAAHV